MKYISPTIATTSKPPPLQKCCSSRTLVVPWNLDEEEVKRQIDARAAEKAVNAVGRGRGRGRRRGTCAMADGRRRVVGNTLALVRPLEGLLEVGILGITVGAR